MMVKFRFKGKINAKVEKSQKWREWSKLWCIMVEGRNIIFEGGGVVFGLINRPLNVENPEKILI
jgi:hypothetical protein